MRTLIDTCVLSEVQRKQGDPRVRARLEALAAEDIFLSVLTLGELKKGIDKLKASARKRALIDWFERIVLTSKDRILPVDTETAIIWGEIASIAERKGKTVPAVDGLIAATALRHGLHLMTRNVSDFEATGVMLINPWEGVSKQHD
ncbi:type II toxin-antitoxin system VapC family toxin [Botrimarina mediterranea]|uniref:Ribonuclease VapC n=1 Tax=Botrimarina mediterranea TaxID=2528022 RepID=A0A518K268_9BACT|nr:type II toxin-antitoxin system VapC family toxin [Botrimarina mediterranea]QDV71906.1 Toxin FitB [Botrimarina mediterranea]